MQPAEGCSQFPKKTRCCKIQKNHKNKDAGHKPTLSLETGLAATVNSSRLAGGSLGKTQYTSMWGHFKSILNSIWAFFVEA